MALEEQKSSPLLGTGALAVDGTSYASAGPVLATVPPQIVFLNDRWLDRVVALDHMCIPNPWSRELFLKEFEKDISLAIGIVRGEELIAHCFSHLVAGELHVLNLAVAIDQWSRGYGRSLLCFALVQGVDEGAQFATLEVRASNLRAQKLYSGLGFRLVGIRREYYQDNREDALVLARTLARKDRTLFWDKVTSCRAPLNRMPLRGPQLSSV